MFEPEHTNLEAEFLPLAVQVLHLLLQQQDIICNDVLGQIRLHAAQLRQALSPVLQGDLVLLHTITQRSPQQTVRDSPLLALCTHSLTASPYCPLTLDLQPLFLSPSISITLFSLFLPAQRERIKGHRLQAGLGEG